MASLAAELQPLVGLTLPVPLLLALHAGRSLLSLRSLVLSVLAASLLLGVLTPAGLALPPASSALPGLAGLLLALLGRGLVLSPLLAHLALLVRLSLPVLAGLLSVLLSGLAAGGRSLLVRRRLGSLLDAFTLLFCPVAGVVCVMSHAGSR